MKEIKTQHKYHKYTDQNITDTLTENFMPYAMSVIMSRALPEIDGFKPSHRKLLYTMYKMGLLTGNRTKSANVVGQTMRLNPHGDAAIYETMVRLSRSNESLLVPLVDSKGNFGKVYSRDMAYAASRYTEVKLDSICTEIFSDIDNDSVDFVPNYDSSTKEPVLLPTAFPNILVSPNLGIAVGMASNICSFNLSEVCHTTIEYLKNPAHDLLSTLLAPDFSTGGELIYEREAMENIYNSGRGSFRVRAVWKYLKEENIIEITQIPYTTTVEAIIDKVTELIKVGKIKEISDMRDEAGLHGLKVTIDLKRGVDPDLLMKKLMKMTPLMDTFSCNFNILISGSPRVMGVSQILDEWTAFRTECLRRGIYFDLGKKREKLHLLKGLGKILIDIDRAIAIIRGTEEDSLVVPNLMISFGIDEAQADYVAEIKLRNINKQYIMNKLSEIDDLQAEIERLTDIVNDVKKVKAIIIKQLEGISKKYGSPRKTSIVHEHEVEHFDPQEAIEDYPVNLFLTTEGYFKKVTPLSLRNSIDQKLKDGDSVRTTFSASNKDEIVFITNKYQAYKAKLHEFDDTKISVLGDYLPQKLGMDEGENVIFAFLPQGFSGNIIYVFENGKIAKVEDAVFDTKSNRRKLTGAYSDKSALVGVFHATEDIEIVLTSTANRALVVSTAMLSSKSSRATIGVSCMSVKKGHSVVSALPVSDWEHVGNAARYRTRTLPAAGAIIRDAAVPGETEEQITLL